MDLLGPRTQREGWEYLIHCNNITTVEDADCHVIYINSPRLELEAIHHVHKRLSKINLLGNTIILVSDSVVAKTGF